MKSTVVAVAFALLAAACSSSSDGASTGQAQGADQAGACARVPVGCDRFATAPDYQAGVGPQNTSFPAPPPGAVLCGTAGTSISYYLSDMSANDLYAYYQSKVAAAGYEVEAPADGMRACDTSMEWKKESPIRIGGLYVYGDEQAFSVNAPIP